MLNAERKKKKKESSFALIIVKLEGDLVQPQEWPERGLNYTFIWSENCGPCWITKL